ncbi:dirigent protein 11-like [Magnolia sinica]|uniref:dirigent protein 11-like n=1 Tax=Magnolia sinica TaxID=86752 RepID=UPI002657C0EA|nr:dirigent protein 11-like [Magnolia sinica]
MAQTTPKISVSVPIFFLITIVASLEAKDTRTKETNMVFYMQDWETGPKVTSIPVAGINGVNSTGSKFGAILVLDDAITEGVDRNSKELGRARGIFVVSSLDASVLSYMFTIVFTDGDYKGSTLQIQGLEPLLLQRREVSVVSGTGMFRFAMGYAILESAFLDLANLNAVVKMIVTVRHYSDQDSTNLSSKSTSLLSSDYIRAVMTLYVAATMGAVATV